ncbi:MAG: 3-deoxy-7-phosphoheptulonate synthase [Candidatus Gastranaerophilales bacterium]|nr:3-deoxy-7-phosphoheptulonate synthase [Candidatus Gastranaerophilales bacterium]
MIVVMRHGASKENVDNVIKFIESKNRVAHVSQGESHTIIGAVGESDIDPREFELLDGVKEVVKISSSYKLVSRIFQHEDTLIEVNGEKFGAGHVGMIAGPCTIENEEQIEECARLMASYGVKIIRGGAFKPRTSPYSFQGLGEEGLKLIRRAADKYNLAVVSEVMEIGQIPLFEKYADMLQVGARNMQNFNLLKELSKINKPIVLKRGLSATINEWLMAAEYILSGGNRDVILCERGIRTFEVATRNTLDLCAIPVVKKLSHLPIIVDPSHGTGLRDKVEPMSLASVAAGCDGLMLEVHNKPECALCDGAQSLYPEQFNELYKKLKVLAPVVGKTF